MSTNCINCVVRKRTSARDMLCDECRKSIFEYADKTTVPGQTMMDHFPRRSIVLTQNFPEIVCLCGSTRFMTEFEECTNQLTNEGKIVLSVGVSKHPELYGLPPLSAELCNALDELHLRKIDLSDSVFIINPGGYIGESTRREIDYATHTGKPVSYLEPGG